MVITGRKSPVPRTLRMHDPSRWTERESVNLELVELGSYDTKRTLKLKFGVGCGRAVAVLVVVIMITELADKPDRKDS
jgi:hypothetical protein